MDTLERINGFPYISGNIPEYIYEKLEVPTDTKDCKVKITELMDTIRGLKLEIFTISSQLNLEPNEYLEEKKIKLLNKSRFYNSQLRILRAWLAEQETGGDNKKGLLERLMLLENQVTKLTKQVERERQLRHTDNEERDKKIRFLTRAIWEVINKSSVESLKQSLSFIEEYPEFGMEYPSEKNNNN